MKITDKNERYRLLMGFVYDIVRHKPCSDDLPYISIQEMNNIAYHDIKNGALSLLESFGKTKILEE